MKGITLLALLFLNGCSFEYSDRGKIIRDGHFELYSHPHWEDDFADSERYKRVIIVATNDSLGQITPHEERTEHTKTGKELLYQVGGFCCIGQIF